MAASEALNAKGDDQPCKNNTEAGQILNTTPHQLAGCTRRSLGLDSNALASRLPTVWHPKNESNLGPRCSDQKVAPGLKASFESRKMQQNSARNKVELQHTVDGSTRNPGSTHQLRER